ncbi:MAG: Na+/H+ antiporter NhaA [Fermentimonas sp.]|nr:Na+/H+ antiporter NhaA [Fermentimonas sp.]
MSADNSAANSIKSKLQLVITDSRSLGVLLLICTALSLILTNLKGVGNNYYNFWETVIPGFGQLHLPHTILHFINDALMALFFFHVALDIKKEAIDGEISSPRRMMLPVISALFGVAFPALIFTVITSNTEFTSGWAIPAATDIAFTIGLLSLLGKAVSHSMKVFIVALAIIDDLCAILIIALFYGSTPDIYWLLGVAGFAAVIYLTNRYYHQKLVYLFTILLALGMWYCTYRSGIHATFAGVILAFILPIKRMPAFEKRLSFPVNFIIIPIFALANTSIIISSTSIEGLLPPISLGIILGLFVGKPLGISLAVYILTKFKIVRLATNVNWMVFIGVTILAGIGFTMSIFVSNLAFPDNKLYQDIAKLSVLIASVLAMIVGYTWIKIAATIKHKEKVQPQTVNE